MKELISKIKLRKWLIFIGILLCFLCFDIITGLIYYSLGGNLNELTNQETVYFLLIKYLVLIIIFILLYHDYLKSKWPDFIQNIKKYFEISFKNWLIGFLIMIVSNLIINSLISGLGENEANVESLIQEMPLIAFFITTILAPLIEEMVFRKCLQDCFNNKTLYMITSGFLFGFVHVFGTGNLYEYLLIIPYGALGFMFAKTINETDNIYNTILMHMLHNGILTLLMIGVF